ncbi:MAG: tryptophan-rich sensory protein [Oscillospiraceae bacterium]|nr:tryptophan-rich sensory protein [Oscillospiraceae bacterium]
MLSLLFTDFQALRLCGENAGLPRRGGPLYKSGPPVINCWHGGGVVNEKRKRLLLCLAIPLAVGGLSAFFTRNGMERFAALEKPPLTPPGWLFPVVWTILFLLMGAASYLASNSGGNRPAVGGALALYALQLAFNFMWPVIFFNLGWYLFAFCWLVVLWLLILAETVRFYRLSHTAGYLMLPYLIWVAFAGYLNLGVYLLNR